MTVNFPCCSTVLTNIGRHGQVDEHEYYPLGFQSISVSILFKLVNALFPEIQSDLTQDDFREFQTPDGTYHPNLDQFSYMTSDHLRIYFIKHRIHPHINYPQYFSRTRALIAITYQWILTFSEIEEYIFLLNFNLVHFWTCEQMPLDSEQLSVWIDIFFNQQCAKNFDRVIDNSDAQHAQYRIHCALGSKDMFTRGFCLLEFAIRKDASKTTGLLESCRREAGRKLDARKHEPFQRQYFKEMAVTNNKGKEKPEIKARILKIFRTEEQFNTSRRWYLAYRAP